MSIEPTNSRLSAKQAAEQRGVQVKTWWGYVSRGQAPQPDGYADPCGCPWWLQSTLDAHLAKPGARGPSRGSRVDAVPEPQIS